MNFVIAGTGQPSLIPLVSSLPPDMVCLGYLDDNPCNITRYLGDYTIVGGFSWLGNNPDCFVVNSISRTCSLRFSTTQLLTSFGAQFCNLIDPTVNTQGVSIGVGNIIGKNVILEPGASLGDHNIILSSVTVAHDSIIGDYNFLGLNTIVQGNCTIGSLNFFSAGSILEPSITVGSRCIVTAGSVVHTHLKSGHMVLRSPDTHTPVPKFSNHLIDF